LPQPDSDGASVTEKGPPMTSKRSCYVFLQLPGVLDVVPCGRYEREVLRDGRVIGRFAYARSYRERGNAVPLDPYHLPVTPQRYETAKLDGVFGALRDASPDAWGRRVIEKMTGRADLDEMDFLLHGPEDRVGALSFSEALTPPAVRRFNRVLQLPELRRAAQALEEAAPGEPVEQQVGLLLEPGTSLGGARPKNVVEDDRGLWIAKFPQKSDKWNNAPVEAAMLALASRCGIRTPETRVERLGDESVLLVRRFDRDKVQGGYVRHRMVSALTVLDADDRLTDRTAWSYVLLADELRRWSERPAADRTELFRRVVFNALISNLDDHPRNHALIAPGRAWRLAPAYDLTPTPTVAIERRDLALECGPYGRMARRDNVLGAAPRFGLEPDAAGAIIDELKQTVQQHWRDEVLRLGGTEGDCKVIEPAFAYPGFEYETSQA
jgi:serine/threonine-protein kinase HipA